MSTFDLEPRIRRKEGWLYKLSPRGFCGAHIYQKRWFVLDFSAAAQHVPALMYFRSRKDCLAGLPCLGQFSLDNVISIGLAPNDKRFDVVTSRYQKSSRRGALRRTIRRERSFELKAPNVELAQEWVEELGWAVASWHETEVFRTLARGGEYTMYSDQFGVGSDGSVGQRAIHMRFVPAEQAKSPIGALCWCFAEDYAAYRERRRLDATAKIPFSRGRLIPLSEIRGLEVGRRASSVLQRSAPADLPDLCCFAILTAKQVVPLSAAAEDDVQQTLAGIRKIIELCGGKQAVERTAQTNDLAAAAVTTPTLPMAESQAAVSPSSGTWDPRTPARAAAASTVSPTAAAVHTQAAEPPPPLQLDDAPPDVAMAAPVDDGLPTAASDRIPLHRQTPPPSQPGSRLLRVVPLPAEHTGQTLHEPQPRPQQYSALPPQPQQRRLPLYYLPYGEAAPPALEHMATVPPTTFLPRAPPTAPVQALRYRQLEQLSTAPLPPAFIPFSLGPGVEAATQPPQQQQQQQRPPHYQLRPVEPGAPPNEHQPSRARPYASSSGEYPTAAVEPSTAAWSDGSSSAIVFSAQEAAAGWSGGAFV